MMTKSVGQSVIIQGAQIQKSAEAPRSKQQNHKKASTAIYDQQPAKHGADDLGN